MWNHPCSPVGGIIRWVVMPQRQPSVKPAFSPGVHGHGCLPGTWDTQVPSPLFLPAFTEKSRNFGVRFPIVILSERVTWPSLGLVVQGRATGTGDYDPVMQSSPPTLQGCWEGRCVHSFIQCVFAQHLLGAVLGAG